MAGDVEELRGVVGIDLGGREPGMDTHRVPGSDQPDLFVRALARYVEALHRRYPDGPEQMRREGLDGRANITGMHPPKKDTAA